MKNKKNILILILILIIFSSIYTYNQMSGEIFLKETIIDISNNKLNIPNENISENFINKVKELYQIAEINDWSKPEIYTRKTDKNIFLVTLTSEVYGNNNAHLGSHSAKLEINMERNLFAWKIKKFKILMDF